jgi:hypothetical protein
MSVDGGLNCLLKLSLSVGLLPDNETFKTILHPPPSGDGSRQSCKSFREADAFCLCEELT